MADDSEHETPADPNDAARDQPNPEQAAAPEVETDAALQPQLKDMQRRTERYYTVFNGPIHTSGFAFGNIGDRRPRMVNVSDDDLHDALRHFVGPPDFVEASNVLHHHRLVILGGDRRTGRRCGALALLMRSAPPDVVGRRPLVELSPHTATAALIEVAFEPGGRYLLTEYEPGEVTDEQMRFDLEQLRRRLAQVGAVLVATSSVPAFRSHDVAVVWRPVDCREVLNEYLKRHEHGFDDQVRELLQRVAAERRPGEMRRFFEILEISGPAAVEQHFDHSARKKLGELLTEEKPLVPTLLPLVTAVFLPGAVERTYEVHLNKLRELVDTHAHRNPWTREYDETLVPSRHARPEWVTSRTHAFDPRERAVELLGTVSPEFLLTVLYERYGYELWAPVRSLLRTLPSDIDGLGDEQALATGMAVFAQVDIRGASAVLDAWAQDESLPHRWAAAAAVSALCPHEATVNDALRLAIRWSGEKPRKQVVAAMAFGQTLSRVFPIEAMSHLWYLGLGNAVVARAARNQFTALVRAASRDDDQIGRALWIADWQLDQMLRGQAYQDRNIGQAIEMVSAVLSTELADGTTLTLHVLRQLPDQVSRLGILWAEVLRSWSHRTAALESLRTAHDELAADQVSAFIALGQAIRRRLGPPEWEWVCRDLDVAAWTDTTHSDDGGEVAA